MQGRLLLVSADPGVRRLVPLMLAGYDVASLDPLAALGALASACPDLVILDIGRDAGCFVRLADRCRWHGPLIVLAADVHPPLDVHANFFIRKPFAPKDILAAVARMMPAQPDRA